MLASINKGAAYAVSTVLGFIGTIVFMSSGNGIALLFIFFGPTLAILVHELGHAIAAWRCGMRVQEIAVGPIAIRFKPLRIDRAEHLLGEDVGGHVIHDEGLGRYLTRRTDAIITAAGPLANLAAALAAFALANAIGDGAPARLLIGFGYVSLGAFTLSAWPFRLASGRRNDALEFIDIVASGRPMRRAARKPARSPWQAP
jgi:membrane-associated protease RseP (regulator of RpoE activity)